MCVCVCVCLCLCACVCACSIAQQKALLAGTSFTFDHSQFVCGEDAAASGLLSLVIAEFCVPSRLNLCSSHRHTPKLFQKTVKNVISKMRVRTCLSELHILRTVFQSFGATPTVVYPGDTVV